MRVVLFFRFFGFKRHAFGVRQIAQDGEKRPVRRREFDVGDYQMPCASEQLLQSLPRVGFDLHVPALGAEQQAQSLLAGRRRIEDQNADIGGCLRFLRGLPSSASIKVQSYNPVLFIGLVSTGLIDRSDSLCFRPCPFVQAKKKRN